MGIIRILLALSVVIAHTGQLFGFEIVGSQLAVQSFYIISGFYMTLILNEKYIGRNGTYKLFITNRFLRLYPIYWVVLLLTIGTSIGAYFLSSGKTMAILQPYSTYLKSMDIGTLFCLIISNLIIFFQDVVMFLGLDVITGKLFFTSNFSQTTPRLHSFLVIPQAWTIGIELMFYLIAPFIVRRKKRFIFLLIFISLFLRFVIYQNGLNHDPWTHRFFPTELFFFLLGTMSYHIYKKIENLTIKSIYSVIIYVAILLFTLFYSWIEFEFSYYLFVTVFFLGLPFIFELSKKWKIDRYIGELSYPIYISHILVLMVVEYSKIVNKEYVGLVTIILTLFFSILLNELIAKKVELFRQRRVRKSNEN